MMILPIVFNNCISDKSSIHKLFTKSTRENLNSNVIKKVNRNGIHQPKNISQHPILVLEDPDSVPSPSINPSAKPCPDPSPTPRSVIQICVPSLNTNFDSNSELISDPPDPIHKIINGTSQPVVVVEDHDGYVDSLAPNSRPGHSLSPDLTTLCCKVNVLQIHEVIITINIVVSLMKLVLDFNFWHLCMGLNQIIQPLVDLFCDYSADTLWQIIIHSLVIEQPMVVPHPSGQSYQRFCPEETNMRKAQFTQLSLIIQLQFYFNHVQHQWHPSLLNGSNLIKDSVVGASKKKQDQIESFLALNQCNILLWLLPASDLVLPFLILSLIE